MPSVAWAQPSIVSGQVLRPLAKYWGLRPSIETFRHVMGPSALTSPLALRSKNGTVFHQPIKNLKKFFSSYLTIDPGRTISGSRGYHMPNFRSLGASVWACIEYKATHTPSFIYIDYIRFFIWAGLSVILLHICNFKLSTGWSN